MIRFNRQDVYARVAFWAEELVFSVRYLAPYPFRPIDPESYRFLEIRRAIAHGQFNAARDEQEEMES